MISLYSASAGSGKTYLLTLQYLLKSLAIGSIQQPFRRILAITFTRKATAEVKARILKELISLANGESKIDNLKGLQGEADVVLAQILHHYDHFKVKTIDSFFTEIVRTFAKEQKLSFDFQIELNIDEIFSHSVEALLARIGQPGEEDLTDLLTHWAIQNAEEGQKWDFRQSLTKFAKHGFKETYKAAAALQSPSQEVAPLVVINFLRAQGKALLAPLHELCLRYADEVAKLSPHDFDHLVQGTRSPLHSSANLMAITSKGYFPEVKGFFVKMADGTLSVHKPTMSVSGQIHIDANIRPLMSEILSYIDRVGPQFTTNQLIQKNCISSLLIAQVLEEARKYQTENNIFAISNLTDFLAQITASNSAPFIYEKIGSATDHFFIDEMQDTSQMQWDAIQPLIADSLSNGHDTLLVGDIKQAIYRWRSGDWNLMLHRVANQFPGVQEKSLLENWRSQGQIIAFNNTLFQFAAPTIASLVADGAPAAQPSIIDKAYSTAEQTLPQARADAQDLGLVQIALFPISNPKNQTEVHGESSDSDEIDLTPTRQSHFTSTLQNLLQQGYSPSDIAVLVRSKSHANEVTNWIESNNQTCLQVPGSQRIFFSSSDTLTLGGSSVCAFLIMALQQMASPASRKHKCQLMIDYQVQMLGNVAFINRLSETIALKGNSEFDAFFHAHMPQGYSPNFIDTYKYTLLETCMELSHIFNLAEHPAAKSQSAYLLAFLDMVRNCQVQKGYTIPEFLAYWADSGCRRNVPMQENPNAIQILTIHKSKGLEFPVVIVPFADWAFDNPNGTYKENLLWETIADVPGLNFAAIPYGKQMKESTFRETYMAERAACHLDSLNLLYVACTRPIDRLYLFSEKVEAGGSTKTISLKSVSGLLSSFIGANPSSAFQLVPSDIDVELYEMGNPDSPATSRIDTETDIQDEVELASPVFSFSPSTWRNQLKLEVVGDD